MKYSEIGQRTCCSADRDAAERMLKSTAFFRTFAFILMSDAILCISALAGNFSAGTSEGDAIRIASIALLALSLLELFTQLFVRGCSFFTNLTLLVDAAVVILALVAEVAEPTNLVIISAAHGARIVRLFRVSFDYQENSFATLRHELLDEKIELVRLQNLISEIGKSLQDEAADEIERKETQKRDDELELRIKDSTRRSTQAGAARKSQIVKVSTKASAGGSPMVAIQEDSTDNSKDEEERIAEEV